MADQATNMQAATKRPRRWRRWAMAALLAVEVCVVAAAIYFHTHRPTLKVADVKVQRLDFEKLDLLFLLEVKNPTAVPIHMRDVNFDMTALGRRIASGKVAADVAVPAGGAAKVQLPVRVEHSTLLPLLDGRPGQAPLPFDLTVRGKCIAGLVLPLEYVHRGYIYPSHAPTFEVVKIHTSSDKGLKVQVVLAVTNPNNIDLKIEEVRGAIKLHGQTVAELTRPLAATMPAGKTVDITIPLHIDISLAADALLAGGKGLKFEGKFKLGEPASWRKMLLGKRE